MDKAIIQGYINTLELSTTVFRRELSASFREIVLPGAFTQSVKLNGAVPLFFNHKRSIAEPGLLELWENDKGIVFNAVIDDLEVLSKMLLGKIKGCSFTFVELDGTMEDYDNAVSKRSIKEMILKEISVLDIIPAYTSGAEILYIPDNLKDRAYQYFIDTMRRNAYK